MGDFRTIIRDRVLVEMIEGTKNEGSSEWKVLILDDFTVNIISSSCKMNDITEKGISLVENLKNRRQPLPTLDGIYFIQPSAGSIETFIKDMSANPPMYKRAFVFLSSPVNKDFLSKIKSNSTLRSRIASLKEMNLEFLVVDNQGFITDHDSAFDVLFSEKFSLKEFENYMDAISLRLATVFASLNENPSIRFQSARTAGTPPGSPLYFRKNISTKIAAGLQDRIIEYKKNIKEFPQSTTCDLLILDRSFDNLTPVVHDWSYGGIVYDILPLEGNKYKYEGVNASGVKEEKTAALDEEDPIWLTLRDLFFKDAMDKLTQSVEDFASVQAGNTKPNSQISTHELSKMIRLLPKLSDQKDKLDLHVNISLGLKSHIQDEKLINVGLLEQGFAFGDEEDTFKELANFLNENPCLNHVNKIRLLMVYALTNPNKMDPTKIQFWTKIAGLQPTDMAAITNLHYLGAEFPQQAVKSSKTAALFSAFTKSKPENPFVRKERKARDESTFELLRYYPLLQDILEDMVAGSLSKTDFPFAVKEGSESQSSSAPSWSGGSKRTNRTGAAKNQKRLFVFIVGGMMKAEIRVAHLLSGSLNRDVIVGSTFVETPSKFIQKLIDLNPPPQI